MQVVSEMLHVCLCDTRKEETDKKKFVLKILIINKNIFATTFQVPEKNHVNVTNKSDTLHDFFSNWTLLFK